MCIGKKWCYNKAGGRAIMGASPSKPPNDEEEPEHDDEKHDVPHPTTPLSRRHVVHPAKCSRQNPRSLGECVVHMAKLRRRVLDFSPNFYRDVFQQLHLRTQALQLLVVLPLQIIGVTTALIYMRMRRVTAGIVERRGATGRWGRGVLLSGSFSDGASRP